MSTRHLKTVWNAV